MQRLTVTYLQGVNKPFYKTNEEGTLAVTSVS